MTTNVYLRLKEPQAPNTWSPFATREKSRVRVLISNREDTTANTFIVFSTKSCVSQWEVTPNVASVSKPPKLLFDDVLMGCLPPPPLPLPLLQLLLLLSPFA